MHNLKQESSQDKSAAKKMELPVSEEPPSEPFEGQVALTKKPKMPHNWQYMLEGGTMLLVFVVILASVLSSRGQSLKQPVHSVPLPVPTAITGSISPRSIAAPKGNPIVSPVWSDHNVSVTIVDGVAYAGTFDNTAYALRISNGSLLWHTRIEGAVGELPVVVNGVVYVNSYVGQIGPAYLSALRASDGTLLWRYSTDSYILGPTMGDGVIYLASQNDGVTELRASDGARLWHFTTPQESGYQIRPLVNGVLYASTGAGQSGGVYALRASDGTVLWRYTTSGFADMFTASNGGVVYVLSQSKLFALRTSDGHQLWSRAINATFDQSPQIIDGVIYLMVTKISLETPTAHSMDLLPQAMAIGALLWSNAQTTTHKETTPLKATMPLKSGKSTVYAIRASDGTVLWQYPINNGRDSFAGWLKVENGVVYTSAVVPGNSDNTGYISALQSTDGKVLWQDKIDGSPSGALLTGGVIYASVDTTNNSAVYALRAHDGTLIWGYPVNGTLFSDPVLVNTTVYVGAGNGMVYALRADNGALMWHYLTDVGS